MSCYVFVHISMLAPYISNTYLRNLPIVMLMKVMKTIPAFWPEGRDTASCSVLKSLIIKDGRMDREQTVMLPIPSMQRNL